MFNGAYLARRTAEHMNVTYGPRCGQVDQLSGSRVVLGGIEFIFDVGGKVGEKQHPFSVKITPPADDPGFRQHIDSVQTPEFWRRPELLKLRQNINQYERFVEGKSIQKRMEGGSYVFEGVLATNNESKAFFTILNMVVKPVWIYRRSEPL